MIYNIIVCKYFLIQIQQDLKHWTKPATLTLIAGVLSDLTRNHFDLLLVIGRHFGILF